MQSEELKNYTNLLDKLPKRLFELLDYQADNYPQGVCLSSKTKGAWKDYSTSEVQSIVRELALGLLKRGVKKNENVGIISTNRPEWNFADLAILQVGAVSVPMYPNITARDYAYIFEHSDLNILFVSDSERVDVIHEAIELCSSTIDVYSFDEIPGVQHWTELLETGSEFDEELSNRKEASDPTEIFTIIYTSGTTGVPKGVLLNQTNVLSNAVSVYACFSQIDNRSRNLSFLPLCHIFARTNFFFDLLRGVSIYYAESIETIGENLKEVKPTYFSTVPRLLEKVYDKIQKKGLELSGPKRWLFDWSVKLAERYDPTVEQSWLYRRKLGFARKTVFSKWREALGGNIELIAVGASALQPRLVTIFWGADIKVCEGYGLTETSPGVAFTRPLESFVRPGYVGKAMPGVELTTADDNEILVKGPNVMKGYYKQPEITAESFTEDGWFRTGDIGLIEDGYLKITDRKKELLKTSGGKYVAPQPIEGRLQESLLVDQAMIVGDGKNFVSALLVPEFETLNNWCKEQNIHFDIISEAVNHPKVLQKYEEIVSLANDTFARFEQVKKFKLLESPWSIERGELTATLKLRRKIITGNYEDIIESLYGS